MGLAGLVAKITGKEQEQELIILYPEKWGGWEISARWFDGDIFKSPEYAFEIVADLAKLEYYLDMYHRANSKQIKNDIANISKSIGELSKEIKNVQKFLWERLVIPVGEIIHNPNDGFRVGKDYDEKTEIQNLFQDFAYRAYQLEYSLDWHIQVKKLLEDYQGNFRSPAK